MTATFTTTPRTVMQSYRACHRAGYVLRWTVAVGAVVTGAVMSNPLLALGGIAYFALAEWLVRRQLAPYLRGPRDVKVTMTDTEYATAGPDRATSRTWTTFTKVSTRGAFWVLRISSQSAMALPRSALDEAQTAVFIAAMKEKGLLDLSYPSAR